MIEQNSDQPINSTPSTLETTQPLAPTAETVPHKKRRSIAIYVIAFVIALFVILGSATTALAYAITYQRFSLGNPPLEKMIQHEVLSLSFTPKTPEFLLESMAEAQQKVSKHTFDVSVATKSDDLLSSLNLTNLDVQLKGYVDYTNLKNVKLSMDGSLSNQYNMKVRSNSNLIYVKFEKIPQIVFSLLGLNQEQSESILTQWISFDTTPLETDARKYLDENSSKSTPTDHVVQRLRDLLKEPAIIAKFTQSDDIVDGHETYKLHFAGDPVTIDYLGRELHKAAAQDGSTASQSLLYMQKNEEKLSDTVKQFNIDVWIDKKSYYMRKMVSAVSIETPSRGLSALATPLPSEEATKKSVSQFALSLSLDHFGEEMAVETPPTSITMDELIKQLTAIHAGQ